MSNTILLNEVQILTPVVLLIAWSMLMWAWMYATRIPAIQAAKMRLDPNAPNGQQMATLPASVRWKADNYNHLMEQPTVFYALAISLALLGQGGETTAFWAWAYLGLRVAHSLMQTLVNKIELRFALFALSNIPLFVLSYHALTTVMD